MNHGEYQDQCAFFQWAELNSKKYPILNLLYASANGEKRDKMAGARLKRSGVKAGIPDIHLPIAKNGFFGLYIEMKAGKNKPTEKQSWWIKTLRKAGHRVEVCYGWEAAVVITKEYLGIT